MKWKQWRQRQAMEQVKVSPTNRLYNIWIHEYQWKVVFEFEWVGNQNSQVSIWQESTKKKPLRIQKNFYLK
jgi:hypothetical protein